MIAHTLSAWATDTGYESRTLKRMLTRAGIEVVKGRKVTAYQIKLAFIGEIEAATIREKIARAVKIEAENAEAAGDTVRMETVNKIIADIMLPIRQRLLSLVTISNLCNPTDPEFSRVALQTWIDQTFPLLREAVTAIRKKDK